MIRPPDEDESFVLEYPPLLEYEGKTVFEIIAQIKGVETVHFALYQRKSWVFIFELFEPEEFRGTILRKFVRLGNWKKNRPPISSELAKAAKVVGCERRITKSSFKGKLVRCTVRPTNNEPAYTVVDKMLEKLVGV